MSSRQLEDGREEKYDRKLAEFLGISYTELSELEWELKENNGTGENLYSYSIKFKDINSKKILEKIRNLDENYIVEIGVGEYEALFQDL